MSKGAMIGTIVTHYPLMAIQIALMGELAALLVSMISWAVFVATMKAVFLVIAEAAFLAAVIFAILNLHDWFERKAGDA